MDDNVLDFDTAKAKKEMDVAENFLLYRFEEMLEKLDEDGYNLENAEPHIRYAYNIMHYGMAVCLGHEKHHYLHTPLEPVMEIMKDSDVEVFFEPDFDV